MKFLPTEHSISVNKERRLIVALYVDNLFLFSPLLEKIQPLKQALSEAFEMKDLGEAKFVLDIKGIIAVRWLLNLI